MRNSIFNFPTKPKKPDVLPLSFESTICPLVWNVQQNPFIGLLDTTHRHYSHSTVLYQHNGACHVSLCFFLARARSGQVFGASSWPIAYTLICNRMSIRLQSNHQMPLILVEEWTLIQSTRLLALNSSTEGKFCRFREMVAESSDLWLSSICSLFWPHTFNKPKLS